MLQTSKIKVQSKGLGRWKHKHLYSVKRLSQTTNSIFKKQMLLKGGSDPQVTHPKEKWGGDKDCKGLKQKIPEWDFKYHHSLLG